MGTARSPGHGACRRRAGRARPNRTADGPPRPFGRSRLPRVATAHLVARDTATTATVLTEARRVLRTDYGIEHATLQVEAAADQDCQELGW